VVQTDCGRGYGDGSIGPGRHAEGACCVIAFCGYGIVEQEMADWADVVFMDGFLRALVFHCIFATRRHFSFHDG